MLHTITEFVTKTITGFSSWTLLIILLALAVFNPYIASFIAIYYAVFFAVRSIWFFFGVISTFRKTQEYTNINWFSRCRSLAGFEKVHHLVVVPTYKEGWSILYRTFLCLASSNYPLQNVSICLATEASDETAASVVKKVKEHFDGRFANLFITTHTLTPEEAAGKGSNQAYAVKAVQQQLLDQGHLKKNILVTSLDADYRMHSEYLGHLSYQYLSQRDSNCRIFQPIPMFFNNIWKAPFFSRITVTFALQWFMAQLTMPDELVNFSCYALSLELLENAGYWDPAIIQEDSRLYWKVFFTVGEKLKVIPLYIPMYGNAVCSDSFTSTLVSQYKQIKRWAWGVTDFPYVVQNAITHKEICPYTRTKRVILLFFTHLNWATLPMIILFGTSFISFVNPAFSATVLSYNLAYFSSKIFSVSLVFLLAFIVIAELFLYPPKPSHWSFLRKQSTLLHWLAIPFVGIILGAFPALDSQTQSMVGKKLLYQVSPKGEE
ncbi:MAG: glycosyltransferase family 2 protein [bacterium]